MPLHEYVCKRCGVLVERLITRPDDLDTQRCVTCGQLMVRRPSTASFSVKGLNAANHYGLKS